MVYIREAHPIDSNWGDPSLGVIDPTTLGERLRVARRCAAALNLSVPMAVDSVDDRVSMAYNAWPERLYVLKPDGTIHYKSGLGPMGFKPRDCAAALAKLLGEAPPTLADPDDAPPTDCEDDGFSGLWSGDGKGPASGGQDMPIRFRLALGADGTVAGRAELSAARQPIQLSRAKFDEATGRFTATVRRGRMRMQFEATVGDGGTMKGAFTMPNGQAMFEFNVARKQIGYPLVPGTADATGNWIGTATARDPALSGKAVVLELTEASAKGVKGTISVAGKRATIQRGRYVAKTGAFSCSARAEDGSRWQVIASVRGTNATGSAMMPGVALAVEFTVKLAPQGVPRPTPKKPPADDGEDF